MPGSIGKALTWVGVQSASPWAFAVALVFCAIWLVVEPESLNWHGAATIATLFMTLFIQRAEHRDTQAIHAKLDELVRARPGARNAMADIDDEEPETIERRRNAEQRKS